VKTRIQDAFDNIVYAHRVVRESTLRLQRTEDPDEIAATLADLQGVLPSHFRAEERPEGYFDHLRRALPHDAEGQVAALVVDHREMEQTLGALMEAEAHDAEWVARAQKLARRLRDHEQSEARLGAAPIDNGRL